MCDRARRELVRIGLEGVDYAQHHLPKGYLGDAQGDLAFLDREVQDLIEGCRPARIAPPFKGGAIAWANGRENG